MAPRTSSPPRDQTLEEPQRVLAWRASRLVRAGYDEASAERLARSGVDLHTAVELLEQGCSVELALQILE